MNLPENPGKFDPKSFEVIQNSFIEDLRNNNPDHESLPFINAIVMVRTNCTNEVLVDEEGHFCFPYLLSTVGVDLETTCLTSCKRFVEERFEFDPSDIQDVISRTCPIPIGVRVHSGDNPVDVLTTIVVDYSLLSDPILHLRGLSRKSIDDVTPSTPVEEVIIKEFVHTNGGE